MAYDRVYNFSAGPGQLPESVLERARDELMNYGGTGMCVMEMSHRSKAFDAIFQDTKARFIRALDIPDTHGVLFLQGGASTQFSAVALNLIGKTGKADYAVTGNFANLAKKEAAKYGQIHVAYDGGPNYTHIPTQAELDLDPEASYFYYCANNTIFGTEWSYTPEVGDVTLVADMSSDILTRPVDVSKYGVIFAGAQKNLAPAGLTIVILRKDLAGSHLPITPQMLEYQLMLNKDSMYNTPPCWCIYMLGLVLQWAEDQGGLAALEQRKRTKAAMLYDAIDSSRLFTCTAEPGSRSDMNVTFQTPTEELDAKFIAGAAERGLVTLKGHRLVGHMRASIYNAMPVEGVEALCDYIRAFDKEN